MSPFIKNPTLTAVSSFLTVARADAWLSIVAGSNRRLKDPPIEPRMMANPTHAPISGGIARDETRSEERQLAFERPISSYRASHVMRWQCGTRPSPSTPLVLSNQACPMRPEVRTGPVFEDER